MKKGIIILLLGLVLGFIGGLYANYKTMARNATLELAISGARQWVQDAEKKAAEAEDAAGQMSDVIRCWMDHHPEQADSILEYAGAFCDTTNVRRYLPQYVYAY